MSYTVDIIRSIYIFGNWAKALGQRNQDMQLYNSNSHDVGYLHLFHYSFNYSLLLMSLVLTSYITS